MTAPQRMRRPAQLAWTGACRHQKHGRSGIRTAGGRRQAAPLHCLHLSSTQGPRRLLRCDGLRLALMAPPRCAVQQGSHPSGTVHAHTNRCPVPGLSCIWSIAQATDFSSKCRRRRSSRRASSRRRRQSPSTSSSSWRRSWTRKSRQRRQRRCASRCAFLCCLKNQGQLENLVMLSRGADKGGKGAA